MRRNSIAIVMTPSVFRSAGPLNYAKYITMLFRSMKIETKLYVTHEAPINALEILKIFLQGTYSLCIIPYVQLSELIIVILMMPIAIFKKCKFALVVHDIHGLLLYGAQQRFLWRLLIMFRSGLLKLPHILFLYVSRYSKLSALLTYSLAENDRYFVIYPFWHITLARKRAAKFNKCRITIFAKLSKMMNEEFWRVLAKALSDNIEFYDEITIMGKGSRDEVKRIIEYINLYFTSAVKSKTKTLFNVNDELRNEILRESCVLIYPPSTEGLGLPLFEATVYEIPCLSWRFTAQKEFIPRELYRYSTLEPNEFSRALQKLLIHHNKWMHKTRILKLMLMRITLSEILRLLKEISR